MKTANEAVRLDKWLWAARFYKTRSIARNMVDGGKVHYNGQRSKPSKIVELGAVIHCVKAMKKRRSRSIKFPISAVELQKLKPFIPKRKKAWQSVKHTPNSVNYMHITQALNVVLTKSNVVTSSSSSINKLEGTAKWQTMF